LLTHGTGKDPLNPKRRSKPQPLITFSTSHLSILRNTKKLPRVANAFLNDLKRAMGVDVLLMVRYVGDDDMVHAGR